MSSKFVSVCKDSFCILTGYTRLVLGMFLSSRVFLFLPANSFKENFESVSVFSQESDADPLESEQSTNGLRYLFIRYLSCEVKIMFLDTFYKSWFLTNLTKSSSFPILEIPCLYFF